MLAQTTPSPYSAAHPPCCPDDVPSAGSAVPRRSVVRRRSRARLAAPPGTGTAGCRDGVRRAARLFVFGGEPFDEPLVMWWNFVGPKPRGDRRGADRLGGRMAVRQSGRVRRKPAASARNADRPAQGPRPERQDDGLTGRALVRITALGPRIDGLRRLGHLRHPAHPVLARRSRVAGDRRRSLTTRRPRPPHGSCWSRRCSGSSRCALGDERPTPRRQLRRGTPVCRGRSARGILRRSHPRSTAGLRR